MTEYSENNFEQCIKCTVCTVYCPAAAANPLFPGPKQAGPDGERLRLKQPAFYDEALKYCLNCKRCEVACPSNVRIGDIIQLARIRHGRKRPGCASSCWRTPIWWGRSRRRWRRSSTPRWG